MSSDSAARPQDQFLNDYWEYLSHSMDLLDWGLKDPRSGKPRALRSTSALVNAIHGRSFVPRFTIKKLVEHLALKQTFYYRSSTIAPYVLIMGDIDAKHGETDSLLFFNWLEQQYFPGVYSERSTGGKGIHFYFKVNVCSGDHRDLKKTLCQLSKRLDEQGKAKGFLAEFDRFAGTPTVWSGQPHQKLIATGDRGIMGKIPRLQNGMDDLHHLKNTFTMTMDQLHALVNQLQPKQYTFIHKELTDHGCISNYHPHSESSSSPIDSGLDHAVDKDHQELLQIAYGVHTQRTLKTSTYQSEELQKRIEQDIGLLALWTKATSSQDAFERMHITSSLWYRMYGRYAPSAEELAVFYEIIGIAHSGESGHQRRLDRAKSVLEYQRKTERPSKGFQIEQWQPLIDRYVTEDLRCHPDLRYPYRVESDVLAACLHVMTLNAFKPKFGGRMHTTPATAIEAYLKRLRERGVITSSVSNRNKRAAAVKILQLAGLIVLRDSKTVRGGSERGIARKYGLGVNHPRFHEFVQAWGHVVDLKNLEIPATTTAAA